MRAPALLMVSLFLGVLLAGCAGTTVDPPSGTTPTVTTPPGGDGGVITVLAPLKLNITAKTPTGTAWVAPGAAIDLQAVAPTDATGQLTYLWAYGGVPGTAAIPTPAKPDTGSASSSKYLQPGDKVGIRFSVAGSWQMHCHPHPWMRANVTVVEGYVGPDQVDVNIIDGNTPGEFRFVPENIVVKPGAVVVYHNAGTQPHTATYISQDAPVRTLALKGAGGSVSIPANALGWQRVRLFAWDAAGRVGVAHYDIYQADLPTFTPREYPIKLDAQQPSGVPVAVQTPNIFNLVTSYNGTMYVNYTVSDPGSPAESAGGQNLAQVTVHVKLQGETQDTMTSTKKSADKLSARTLVGSYNIEVDPEQGVGVTGTLKVEMVYDITPPPQVGYVDPESIPHTH